MTRPARGALQVAQAAQRGAKTGAPDANVVGVRSNGLPDAQDLFVLGSGTGEVTKE
jgi:hypothetical protein